MYLYRLQNGCYRVREAAEFKDVLLKAEASKTDDEDAERIAEVVRWASKVFIERLLKGSLAAGPSCRLTEA